MEKSFLIKESAENRACIRKKALFEKYDHVTYGYKSWSGIRREPILTALHSRIFGVKLDDVNMDGEEPDISIDTFLKKVKEGEIPIDSEQVPTGFRGVYADHLYDLNVVWARKQVHDCLVCDIQEFKEHISSVQDEPSALCMRTLETWEDREILTFKNIDNVSLVTKEGITSWCDLHPS
jgi:hypothetical protein